MLCVGFWRLMSGRMLMMTPATHQLPDVRTVRYYGPTGFTSTVVATVVHKSKGTSTCSEGSRLKS